ncbi:CPBP family glutamic-type intramembrane protease [Halorubrum sp. FL23]|uniref:CPBP family glutamic-type intramembrane protease n=1 Tax=Halorubrum sp. FL23 TaxID=3458704 RepID=UPI00403327A3
MADIPDRRALVRGAGALFAFGTLGVLALATYSVPSLRETPELASLPYAALVAIASVNSLLLLAVFTGVGTLTAPRLGLDSHVFSWATGGDPDWGAFRKSLPLAAVAGVVLFAVIAVLDAAFAQFTRASLGELSAGSGALSDLYASVPMRLLYGGVTEEILLRWGVMAPAAFVVWWVRNRIGEPSAAPGETTMWIAIVVSAIAFGVGHLPVLVSTVGSAPALIVRTVLLNALAGIALGWLFWRRSLETAMAAHAAFHVALVGVSAVLIRVA